MSECSDIVHLERVARVFAGAKAVDDLSLQLNPGEVMGFLGTNGAGKTTTIKMMLGLLAPTSGTVKVLGGNPSDPRIRAHIGYMPEVATYYPYLNARELLAFYGGICGLDSKTVRSRTDSLLESVGLADAAKRPLKTYSKGMLQRAGIAQYADARQQQPHADQENDRADCREFPVSRQGRDHAPEEIRGDHPHRGQDQNDRKDRHNNSV